MTLLDPTARSYAPRKRGSKTYDVEYNRVHRRRGQILSQARDLARSGQHADCTSIIAALEHVEGFEAARHRFEEDAFRSQIDRLCAMAQRPKSAEGAPA